MDTTHTIRATERRMYPLVVFCSVAATIADVMLVAAAWPLEGGRWVAAGCCALLLAMLSRRFLVGRLSIGMVPVAVFSLGFAGLAAARPLPATLGLGSLAFFAAWFCVLASAYARPPEVRDGATVIVLGCSIHDGAPGATLRLRLATAFDVWATHRDVRLVVSGGQAPDEELSEAEVMRTWLIAHGVPQEHVLMEPHAVNTEENLAFAARLLNGRDPGEQWCVVSSDYHLWRVGRIARTLGIELVPVPAPSPVVGRLVQWSREVLVSVDWLARRSLRASR